MSKSTAPGWPEPTDWANRLHDRLERIGQDFIDTPWEVADDPSDFSGLNLKQARAAEALLAVCNALQELPQFEKSKGAAAIHTVAGALRDVVMGGNPRLFQSVRPGSPGGDGMDRIYLRNQVILAVRFLVQAHGVTELSACKTVATIFADAGATGRRKGPLSASTVKDWCDKTTALASNLEDYRIHNDVEAKLIGYRGDPAWPGTYDDALEWVESLARDPLLVTKYG